MRGKIGFFLIFFCVCCILTACGQASNTRLGLDAYSAGNYTQAVEYFQAAIVENNTVSENYIYQGMAYIALEKYENAKKDFYLAVNLDVQDKHAYRGLGIVCMKEGQYSEAIDFFNQVIECAGHTIGETEYDVLRYRAEAEKMTEQYQEAVKTYSILLQVTTPDVNVYYNRGLIYTIEDKIELAKQDFDAAISLTPNDYQLYWNVYNCLIKAGEEELAKEYLNRTISIQAIGDEVSKYQGIVQCLLGNHADAIEVLTTISQPDLESDVFLALAYEQNADYKNATAIYQKLLEQNSNNPYVYNQIALYYLRQNSAKKALKYIQKGINTKSNSEDIKDLCFNQIVAYEKMGQYEEALKVLQEYKTEYGEDDKLKKEEQFLMQHSSENN